MKRLFLLSILLLPLCLSAAVGSWQTLTNTFEIRQFALNDSILWCATNGGILRVNTDTFQFEKFTNTEGLAQIDVVAIAYDPNGFIWAAMPNGLLQIYDLETNRWDIYNEFQNELTVSSIVPNDSVVLVGFDNGIAELRRDAKNRWERTWKADIGGINDIIIADNYIWVAQDDGVRRISLDFPNKQIPSAWQYFSVGSGLPSAQVNTLLYFSGSVIAGTAAGVSYFAGAGWSGSEQLGQNVKSLAIWNGNLAMASAAGLFRRDLGGTWTNIGPARSNSDCIRADANGVLWLGTTDAGLFYWNGTAWTTIELNCPNSNVFSDLLIDRDGHLWATSSKNPSGGVYYFDGLKWKNFTSRTGLAHFDSRCLEEDIFGRIWAGSWGGGVTLFEKIAADSIQVTNLYTMDGNLSATSATGTYTVIMDIKSDAQGNLWFLNSAAGNKQALHVYDLDSSWEHWTTTDGIRSQTVSRMALDNVGRVWIGTGASDGLGGNGVSVLDNAGTIFDKSDDDLTGFLDETEGLESNNISSLVEDLDGTMWIGTSKGLNYWFGSVGARYNVINDNIQALYVDPRNNKWIGTAGGLSVLDSDNFSWKHYTTSNSMLVSDIVTCFAFNEQTGEIYIGTTNGLSRFETPYTQPAANLSTVTGYPNPFVIAPQASRFYIDNLALNSTVNIYTPDGYLVKAIPRSEILGARVSWDGTNDEGDYVASGIYVYLVTTKDGQAKAGKIAVVRP